MKSWVPAVDGAAGPCKRSEGKWVQPPVPAPPILPPRPVHPNGPPRPCSRTRPPTSPSLPSGYVRRASAVQGRSASERWEVGVKRSPSSSRHWPSRSRNRLIGDFARFPKSFASPASTWRWRAAGSLGSSSSVRNATKAPRDPSCGELSNVIPMGPRSLTPMPLRTVVPPERPVIDRVNLDGRLAAPAFHQPAAARRQLGDKLDPSRIGRHHGDDDPAGR